MMNGTAMIHDNAFNLRLCCSRTTNGMMRETCLSSSLMITSTLDTF
jgi:hypothetical protein